MNKHQIKTNEQIRDIILNALNKNNVNFYLNNYDGDHEHTIGVNFNGTDKEIKIMDWTKNFKKEVK